MADLRKPRLLVVDDDSRWLAIEREILEDCGYEVFIARSAEQAQPLIDEHFFDLLILDQRMGEISGTQFLAACRQRDPGIGAIFMTGFHDEEVAVDALRLGALNFLHKPVNREEFIKVIRRALDESQIAREARLYRHTVDPGRGFAEIVGQSAALETVLSLVKQAIPTDVTVLIQGESGTGKELVAHAIHYGGHRKDGPFVPLNAGAIPSELVESALFGHKKGSFTGALYDRKGCFEEARGGTVFLDEIGEMPEAAQIRLLRVLQEKKVTRIGENFQRPVDARVIAASYRNLRAEVEARRFRDDLFFRLAVIPITLPPLRDRIEDIPALTMHLIARSRQETKKQITGIDTEAIVKLKNYSWPGNVRELENVLKLAMVRAEGDIITHDLISLPTPASRITESKLPQQVDNPPSQTPQSSGLGFKEAQLAFRRQYFSELLKQAGGNKTKAAELAGLNRTQLYQHLRSARLLKE